MDFETDQFGKLVDVLTFEIELVNIEALEKLEVKGLKFIHHKNLKRFTKTKGKKQKRFLCG
jgi:5-(carboxyamino)imidazole ribonucleotide synthase